MNTVITIIYLIGVPLLVMQLAKCWTWIEKVSPMSVLYIIGLAVANLLPRTMEFSMSTSTQTPCSATSPFP